MEYISEQTRNDIISLLNENLSLRKIASKVGVSIDKVSRVCNRLGRQDITNRGGRPGKLSQQDRRMTMRLVTSVKADNAVQVAQELSTNINDHISAQTVRITLKNMGMKDVVKKKNSFYLLDISHNDLISFGNINTGPLKIGNVSYGLMRPK